MWKVKYRDLFSFLYMWISRFLSTICSKRCLCHNMYLCHPCQTKTKPCGCSSADSPLDALLHQLTVLALCLPHTLSITMALQYNMKSGTAISAVVLVLFKISLDICVLLRLHMCFKSLFPISVKSDIRILMGVPLNL